MPKVSSNYTNTFTGTFVTLIIQLHVLGDAQLMTESVIDDALL